MSGTVIRTQPPGRGTFVRTFWENLWQELVPLDFHPEAALSQDIRAFYLRSVDLRLTSNTRSVRSAPGILAYVYIAALLHCYDEWKNPLLWMMSVWQRIPSVWETFHRLWSIWHGWASERSITTGHTLHARIAFIRATKPVRRHRKMYRQIQLTLEVAIWHFACVGMKDNVDVAMIRRRFRRDSAPSIISSCKTSQPNFTFNSE